MTNLAITHHAAVRLAQRALAPTDIELIMDLGAEVRDGYFMRARDAREAIAVLRALERQIERLSGQYAVTAGDTLVTAYTPSRKRSRRILRRRC
jgi:hypothetical protein